MHPSQQHIHLAGGGLVGTLMAILLARRGYRITVLEKRPDLRTHPAESGRSINLALSQRGWKALRLAQVAELAHELVVPMKGRMLHSPTGELRQQPYGQAGQAIYSIPRSGLNELLLRVAGQYDNIEFCFEERINRLDLRRQVLETEHTPSGYLTERHYDLLIGADGAFSMVRAALLRLNRFNYSQTYLEHGYKELTIPAGEGGSFLMEPHALHIWPRQQYMLIALPNADGSFTVTLFLNFEGDEPSFDSLNTPDRVAAFFAEQFPDVVPLMPDLAEQFFANPTGSMVTVRCQPWSNQRDVFLLGDAAHAIVPFYGQGMNAGFEDCTVLNALLDQHQDDWATVLPHFEQSRQPDADAIAELALQNFVEMRDRVADPRFLLRKKIEAHLHAQFPEHWVPLYTQVTFSDRPYSEALHNGKRQEAIMADIMAIPDIASRWQELDYRPYIGLAPRPEAQTA